MEERLTGRYAYWAAELRRWWRDRTARGVRRVHTCLQLQTDVFVSNEPVRRLVRTARNGNATDVLRWGRRRPAALNRRLVPVRNRPSAAAQVFKSHALAARGAFVTEPAEEGFYSMT